MRGLSVSHLLPETPRESGNDSGTLDNACIHVSGNFAAAHGLYRR